MGTGRLPAVPPWRAEKLTCSCSMTVSSTLRLSAIWISFCSTAATLSEMDMCCLPGPLREPISNLKRADAFVITHAAEDVDAAAAER